VDLGRFELPTPWLQNMFGKAISLILRHGWQPKSTQKHIRNAEVVPILYSFERLGNAKMVLHGIHCLPLACT
jgi:hypothetical protein